MRAIDIRDLDIPEQDAGYDELVDFADRIAKLVTDAIEVAPVRYGQYWRTKMNDLISRQSALEALTVTEEMGTAELLWLLTTRINDLPTVEPKRGHWIEKKDFIYCSECADGFDAINKIDYRYCPNCGARME